MERIELAIKAAKLAGVVVKEGFDSIDTKSNTKSHANDILTEYDLKSQEIIVAQIRKYFPSDEIIGEENGFDTSDAKTAWVIDPIDGTNPYSRKTETFGIVIGYMKDFKAEFCVVYNPVLEKLCVAQAGKGATCNDESIQIAQRPFENQLVSVEAFDKRNRHYFRYLLGEHIFNAIGKGSSCHATIMAASGQSDAFIGKANHIWDRIHYILLIEAGAKLTNFKGEEYTIDQKDYIACHPKYHEKYIEILSETVKKLEIKKKK